MSTLLTALSQSSTKSLRPQLLGSLHIASGKIVACDPLIPHTEPFERTISPGTYPVVVWWNDDETCIAAAKLKLAEARPIRWEMAVKHGQKVEELQEGYIFGYPVDTGLGCFADVEAIKKLNELEDQMSRELGDDFISLYDNLIDELLTENEDEWCIVNVSKDPEMNVIIFRSGFGDGFYASYWGFDEKGSIVSLVTDFHTL